MNPVLNELPCGPTGVEISPDALASSEGTMTMVFNDQDTTGSTAYSRPVAGDRALDRKVTVRKRLVNNALDSFNVTGNIDFVKLDCEGCEYDIVPALRSGMLARIGYVAGEIHPGMRHSFEDEAVREAKETMCTRGWQMRNL